MIQDRDRDFISQSNAGFDLLEMEQRIEILEAKKESISTSEALLIKKLKDKPTQIFDLTRTRADLSSKLLFTGDDFQGSKVLLADKTREAVEAGEKLITFRYSPALASV